MTNEERSIKRDEIAMDSLPACAHCGDEGTVTVDKTTHHDWEPREAIENCPRCNYYDAEAAAEDRADADEGR